MNAALLNSELNFKGIRSSGAGGQHVNKVASKVELTFHLKNSEAFSETEKERLLQKLNSRLTKDGTLVLQCGESRSQHRNKEIITKRFFKIIHESLKVSKLRKATKPSKSSILKRLKNKKTLSLKKSNRRKPEH